MSEVTIRARTWNIALSEGSSEHDCKRSEVPQPFESEKTALVVIDPWAAHPNEGWLERARRNMPNLVRLIQLFRNHHRPIYYDSTGLPIHESILAGAGPFDHFLEWDPAAGTTTLNALLVEGDIQNIFWGGYAANLCLMSKPRGIRKIMSQHARRLHFLVRDATIAFESDETLEGERLLDAACYEVEYYPNGFSCTVDAVDQALGGVRV
jgi:hypothetical protein